MKVLLTFCLAGSAFCLGLGLVLPLVELERLFVLTDRPSLIEIIIGLTNQGSWAIAAVVAVFSVLFPAAKILAVTASALGAGRSRITGMLAAVSKWSMLDVLLVAILIFAAKTSGLASAVTQPGVWFFAASTLLAAGASFLVRRERR
ncbi:MAG: paraquat-inducible protein A [Pseudomonadota bacterium]